MDYYEVKHLEFIQTNIARMSRNSFQMKGWAITILTALLALYATSTGETSVGNVTLLFIAIIPIAIFWLLDSYYLQQERKFRGIYNDMAKLTVAPKKTDVRVFEMPLNKYNGGEYSFHKVVFSPTEWPIYLPIIIGLIITGIVLI